MNLLKRSLKSVKLTKFLPEVIFFSLLIFLSVYFIDNLETFEVPNSDVFAFIYDARDYYRYQFPSNLHLAPGTPLLIGFLSKFINHQYSELLTASLLSKFFSLAFLISTWKFTKKTQNKIVGLLLVFFLASHRLFHSTSLDSMPEPLFAFLIIFSLIKRGNNKKLSYFLCGLSFLVRYESLALFATYFLSDFFQYIFVNKTKKLFDFIHQNWFKGAAIASLFILSWSSILLIQNFKQDGPGGFFYFDEIRSRSSDIPQWSFIKDIPGLFSPQFDDHPITNPSIVIFLYLMLGFAIFSLDKKTNLLSETYLFVLLYSIIHLFFPAHQKRYLFPILFPLIWMVLSVYKELLKKTNNIKAALFVFYFTSIIFTSKFIYQNYRSISPTLEYYQNYDLTNKRVALWLNEQRFSQKKTVILLLPWITEYFMQNNQILLTSPAAYPECESIYCIANKLNVKNDLLIGLGSQTADLNSFNVNELNVLALHHQQEKACLSPIVKFKTSQNYLTLYNYDYTLCNQLMTKN